MRKQLDMGMMYEYSRNSVIDMGMMYEYYRNSVKNEHTIYLKKTMLFTKNEIKWNYNSQNSRD